MTATKQKPPALTRAHIARDQLSELICSSTAAKLVLVCAPGGFGKTTVLTQCYRRFEQSGVRVAWLTLDSADSDAPRFVDSLSATLASLETKAGAAGVCVAENAISWQAGRASSIEANLTQRLAAIDEPFALILDDFDVVRASSVSGLMREILDTLPSHGRLVIGSRSQPDLDLPALVDAGQALEVGVDHLRLSVAESHALLCVQGGLTLCAADVVKLQGKTEGWVLALSLARAALARREAKREFIERFSGTNVAIAEYLANSVLAHAPRPLRDFLLRTSILRELDPVLCRVLDPDTDAEAMLAELDRENLFVIPIDGERRAWRYHSLFADFLRERLAEERPGELHSLHVAASQWYEREGQPVPSIDHAIEAHDETRAARLLLEQGEAMLARGRFRLLARWFDALAPAVRDAHPLLIMLHVWALCFTRGPRLALALFENSGCIDDPSPCVQAHVNACRPLLLAMMDRGDDAELEGEASLARLPTASAFADSTLANAMARIVATRGRPHEARELIATARRADSSSTAYFSHMYSESTEGLIDLVEGRLKRATVRLRTAVNATPAIGPQTCASGNAWAGVPYAVARYEADALQEAERLLQVYVPLARDVSLTDHMIIGYVTHSRIAFDGGDASRGFQWLTELEYLGHERELGRLVAAARLERARVLLLEGKGDASRVELDRAADFAEIWARAEEMVLLGHETESLALARERWAVHFGDAEAAARTLERAASAAEAAGRRLRALKLRVLECAAHCRAGNDPAALAVLAPILRMCHDEGYVRVLKDEGPLLANALGRYAQPSVAPFAAWVQRFASRPDPAPVGGHTTAGGAVARSNGAVPLEPLTRKELRVLQLLAEGHSNTSMAETLFVSDSTVRTHLRHIHAKLSVRNRTSAVAVARRLGLIS